MIEQKMISIISKVFDHSIRLVIRTEFLP